MSSVLHVSSSPHTTIIGAYKGPHTGMSCLTHCGMRNGRLPNAQPMTLADLKHEECCEERSDLWCAGCAKKWGRQRGHEYVIQREGYHYEVIDITFPDGSLVAKRGTYDECNTWLHGRKTTP